MDAAMPAIPAPTTMALFDMKRKQPNGGIGFWIVWNVIKLFGEVVMDFINFFSV
jgi:hypothetical protein